ncbi:hypothetical protein H2201_004644 [Coniosporium apollinis]|uniref:Phosphoribosylaminoimidazole carboxylase n=1 Tax=Coniosporium apollinis TaxID=61459 RepID=A0ABQ9NV48_9PEZI|nr:hypothetical protein H2201_004644 [Coniosporium apollinis]
MDGKVVGVLGGGQLGRMLIEAANRLGIRVNILDSPGAPAKQISAHDGHVDGSFKDRKSIEELASRCDVLTVEIEHVDTEVLEDVQQKSKNVTIEPSWSTIRLIQDKYRQKEHLASHEVATAESVALDSNLEEELRSVGEKLGYPFMLKSRKEAYDGRGNYPVRSEEDVLAALEALGKNALYAERWADFKMELAVMVVKTKDGTLAFPTVETHHENSVCKLVWAPARNVSTDVSKKAQDLAKKAVSAFEGKGVFGVEMFLLRDNSLLINEIAPRPHNSGHYTIEACPISQYDAHLRAILDLPIPEASLQLREPAIMLNILGGKAADSHIAFVRDHALANPRTSIHLYGKAEARPGRKMGHVTVTASTMHEAEALIEPLVDAVDEAAGKPLGPREPKQEKPLVAVIMGSDSDMPVLKGAFDILRKFGISYQARILSAHRTPDRMFDFAKRAEGEGFRVIIAAAGGAAHLPGMTASDTVLPVIGVPVRASHLDGLDSLLSEVQMPRGVPCAVVGINNSTNAGLLAARILGVADERIRRAIREHQEASWEEVRAKDERLMEIGPEEYLKGMRK